MTQFHVARRPDTDFQTALQDKLFPPGSARLVMTRWSTQRASHKMKARFGVGWCGVCVGGGAVCPFKELDVDVSRWKLGEKPGWLSFFDPKSFSQLAWETRPNKTSLIPQYPDPPSPNISCPALCYVLHPLPSPAHTPTKLRTRAPINICDPCAHCTSLL